MEKAMQLILEKLALWDLYVNGCTNYIRNGKRQPRAAVLTNVLLRAEVPRPLWTFQPGLTLPYLWTATLDFKKAFDSISSIDGIVELGLVHWLCL